jgi:F0F1-type ATP synthase assembly protein I
MVTSEHPSDETPDTSTREQSRSDWAKAGMIGALGFELVAFVGIGIYGGTWLDQRLGTAPFGLLVGLLVSTLAAGVHIWKMVTRLMPNDDDES